jgi:hypothetical protein
MPVVYWWLPVDDARGTVLARYIHWRILHSVTGVIVDDAPSVQDADGDFLKGR